MLSRKREEEGIHEEKIRIGYEKGTDALVLSQNLDFCLLLGVFFEGRTAKDGFETFSKKSKPPLFHLDNGIGDGTGQLSDKNPNAERDVKPW